MTPAARPVRDDERMLCRTPTPGKQPTSIPAWKYRIVHQALLAIVPDAPPGIAAKALPDRVAAVLPRDARERLGSVSWHVTTVRLNMEVEGELRRVAGRKPLHVVRIAERTDVTVRPVEVGDKAQWVRMRQTLFDDLDEAFHEVETTLYAAAADKRCLIAEVDGVCVGFAELSLRNVVDGCLSSPVGYVEGVFVKPEARGMGVSRALIEHAVRWFERHGCSEMATDTLADDTAAQDFHRRMGFSETYRIVQFRQPLVDFGRRKRNA